MVIGGLGPIAVAGLLVGVRGEIVNANVALALVVVVVVAAITGGRAAGALAAVVATLSFDFFHTEPYLRLTIDSANDVETTLLLLVVGLTVGELAANASTWLTSGESSSPNPLSPATSTPSPAWDTGSRAIPRRTLIANSPATPADRARR